MARPGPRRIPISVKVAPADLTRIDVLAAAAGLTRSMWVRQVLDAALTAGFSAAPRGAPTAGARPRTDQPPVVAEPYIDAP